MMLLDDGPAWQYTEFLKIKRYLLISTIYVGPPRELHSCTASGSLTEIYFDLIFLPIIYK
jgi:hypothetical protein